jgi:hypothetical protein
MATYDLTSFTAPSSTVQPVVNVKPVPGYLQGDSIVIVRNMLDLEDYDTYKVALAQDDILKVLPLPRASMFLGGGCRIVRAAVGTDLSFTHLTDCNVTCIADTQTYTPIATSTAIAAGKIGLIGPSTTSPFVMDDATDATTFLTATLTTVTSVTNFGKYEWFGVFLLVNVPY